MLARVIQFVRAAYVLEAQAAAAGVVAASAGLPAHAVHIMATRAGSRVGRRNGLPNDGMCLLATWPLELAVEPAAAATRCMSACVVPSLVTQIDSRAGCGGGRWRDGGRCSLHGRPSGLLP